MKAEEIASLRELTLDHVWVPLHPWKTLVEPGGFNIFVEGKGCRVTDVHGKTYIDYYSGLGNVLNLGYDRKEIADAIYEQTMKLPYRPTHEVSLPQIKLAQKLADLAPVSLARVHFCNSGTEANETAMKIARMYQQLKGFHNKHKIIVGGCRYHGSTYGSMSLGWNRRLNTWEDYETQLPGVVQVPSPPCFRCELGHKYPECDLQCVKFLDNVIYQQVPDTVAAFLDVPITTEHATPPPPNYWPAVRAVCNKYGMLLIMDEVMKAFGRTGKMFASEHWNLEPDIITVAKSLTNGYIPLGATIVARKVAQEFEGGFKEMLKHSYTFDGHPAACAAGLATLNIIERENILENSRVMGKYLLEGLQSLQKHRTVGVVRGEFGLDYAIEFLKDREKAEPFSTEENSRFVSLLKQKARQAGLWGTVGNPLLVTPPLIVTKADAEEIVSGFDKALGEVEKEF